MSDSRAVRNNSPGNLRPGFNKDGSPRILWQGQTGVDSGGYATFSNPDAGKAAARQQVLHDYNSGLRTPLALATKYASSPGDDPVRYSAGTAGALGVSPNQDAGLSDPAKLDAYMNQLFANEDASGGKNVNSDDAAFDQAVQQHASDTNDANFDAAAGASAPNYKAGTAPSDAIMSMAAVPNGDVVTNAMNKIVSDGVAQGRSKADIKADVDKMFTANGIDPTTTTGVNDVIDYRLKGGTQGSPVMGLAKIKPLTAAQTVAAGIQQGVRDFDSTFDKPSKWLEANIPGMAAAGQALGLPSTAQAADTHEAARALFDATAGQTALGDLGRLGADIGVTAPIMGAGGKVLGALADVAGAASPIARGAVDFLAGNAGKAVAGQGGNALARVASLGANGSLQGATGATLLSGGNDASLGDQMKLGAMGGAVLAPVASGLVRGGNAITNAVMPKLDTETARLAQYAQDAGLHLEGGQITANPLIRRMDAQLENSPLSGIAQRNADQQGAFTAAVGRTFGTDSPRLTPEVMSAAKDRIGSVMNDVAAKTKIHADDTLLTDLGRIQQEAPQALPDSEAAPILKQIENIVGKIGPDGTIDGATYQALTRKGAPLDVAMSNHDSNISQYAGQVRDALDGALSRSAAPEDVKALQAARYAYKNLMTVAPLAAKSPDGTISPALLNSRVSANFKNRAFSGAGDLGDLAAVGQKFLKPPSSSGTAENIKAQKLVDGTRLGLGLLAAGAGHLLGMSPRESLGASALVVGSGIVNAGANKLIAAAIRRPAYANKLINSALDNSGGAAVPGWLAPYLLPAATVATNRLIQGSGVAQPR